MKVAILGAGPAGLLAAHAAQQSGWLYTVYSRRVKSSLFGAQYLHQNIPGIPDIPSTNVQHIFEGTVSDYRSKVYGTEWDGVVSPEQFSGTQFAWDIRAAYDWLWEEYNQHVMPSEISGERLMNGQMLKLLGYDMIISTIPRKALCVNPDHKFKAAKIWCVGDAPALGITVPVQVEQPGDVVICNGERTRSWYRYSRIFGHATVEWSAHNKTRPPIEGVVEVLKPVGTNCTCWPEISYQGRYGKWEKGVLTHHAYWGAALAMREATYQNHLKAEAREV